MKKNFLYGAMALGLLFAGCSSDDIIENNGGVLQEDQTFYVSMKISGDMPGSRADDPTFEAGTGSESKVTTAYFVFYDAAGQVVGEVTPVDLTTGWQNVAGDGSVEKTYKDVVAITVMKGEAKPTQCICYINPINPGTLNKPLDAIQNHTVEEVYRMSGTERIFAMSNSVYYQDNTATAPNVAVQIPEAQLYPTQAAAEAALNADNVVSIYVERYATKLKFTVADDANNGAYKTGTRIYTADDNYDTKDVELTFVPQYWAVNAQSKKSYVVKSFLKENYDASASDAAKNYDYADLDAIINKGLTGTNVWTWNSPSNFRSYWGMSPAYFTEVYPEVSSDLDPEHSEAQKYISYNDLVKPNNGIGYAATDANAHYFKETTVGSKALASKNPAAAVASVIYVGQYTLKVGNAEVAAGTPFYTYRTGNVSVDGKTETRPYVYFDNNTNNLDSKVANGGSLLKRMLIVCSTLYKQVVVDGKTEYVALSPFDAADAVVLASNLQIAEISDKVKAAYNPSSETSLKIQANARTLQLKGVPTESAGIYVLNNNGYQQVVADGTEIAANEEKITLTEANVALMKNVGVAYYYNLGHAYFNIPVKHLGWYRAGNPNNVEGAEFNWNDVRVGDYGMVRNHSYTVNVSKITGLAEGIGGDDVEIVPPAAKTNYFLAYQVNILKWAVVPTQNENL
ncbi:MAG: fimbria major subunit [Muribaculaceae bacterium]|nr:fimbria major subunit [Muribaculaceae bacterium]